jgi:hypothetical protein
MGFIKHALIGIALYEAVKYFLNKEDLAFGQATNGIQAGSATRQQLRDDQIDIIAGARQTDQLSRMKENAANEASANNTGINSEPRLTNQDLEAGINPDTPLTGHEPAKDQDDPWKNSLANDELRAPDS